MSDGVNLSCPCEIKFFDNNHNMQGDLLLQEWKESKSICGRIIEICKVTHLGKGNIEGRVLLPGEKQTGKQFINVYDVVYRLCVTKQKEENRVLMVYKDYKDILKTALLDMCPLLNEERDTYRLDALRKIWEAYCDIQKRLKHMFAYLDRPFHIKDGKIDDLDKTATNIILATLFQENSVMEYDLLYFKEIDKIRKSQQFGCQKILAHLIDIFYQVHIRIVRNTTNKKIRTIYTELYGRYQKTSREFYSRRFRVLKQLNPAEYFQEIDKLYQLQKQIAENCFVITADVLFSREFAEELLVSYKQILLQSEYGLKFILKQGQLSTLKLIVNLYVKLTKSLDGFKQQFEEYVYEEMKGFMEDCKAELAFKKSLLTYCNFVEKVIRKNQQLVTILESLSVVGDFVSYYKSGVEKAFMSAKLAVPIEELLAIFVDTKFRVEMEEGEYQSEVKNIITIFNCIQNKDLFLLKYSQRLAKRVLSLNQSCLNNHEIFTANLKMNCGVKYTERLQTMITEYRMSTDNQQLLNQIQERQKLPISFTLKAFSEGAWPTQTILQVPMELMPNQIHLAENCLTIYSAERMNKKTLKISALESKMRWSYFFDAEVKHKNESCYFDTNCLQAIILFYVYRNRPSRVSLQVIEQLLSKISSKLIRENISKMTDNADNILIRVVQGDDTFFQFNLLMKSSKKLIAYDQGATHEEQKLFQQHDLGKDREIVIDANISKLMKARKVVDFKTLIEEVTKMVRVFVPLAKDIKMAVDRLIAKEILQRDERDRELIRYRD